MKKKTGDILSKLYVRILLGVAVFVFIFVSFYLFYSSRDSITQDLYSRADTIATTLSSSEKGTFFFGDARDLQNPAYIDLKKTLQKLRTINSDVRFVYLLKKSGADVSFIADSENPDSPDYSPPGQVYSEASKALKGIFDTGSTTIEGPLGDRWGTWVSALSPVFDENGKVLYVLGIDISANSYKYTPIINSILPIFAVLILLILIVIGTYFRKKELQIINLKNQFISIASHELRSPLTGIRWSTETLLSDDSLSKELKEIVLQARSSCLYLIDVVNQLLDVSLIESGMADKINKEECGISESITKVMEGQKLFAEAKNVKVDLKDNLNGAKILGDKIRLNTAFDNLLSNAIKYSNKDGEVHIIAILYKNRAIIDFVDKGIGIPKKELHIVTKGFYRASNAKKSAIKGTGLGLHLAEEIIRAFGGRIYVRSEEGIGTTVSVELPIIKAK